MLSTKSLLMKWGIILLCLTAADASSLLSAAGEKYNELSSWFKTKLGLAAADANSNRFLSWYKNIKTKIEWCIEKIPEITQMGKPDFLMAKAVFNINRKSTTYKPVQKEYLSLDKILFNRVEVLHNGRWTYAEFKTYDSCEKKCKVQLLNDAKTLLHVPVLQKCNDCNGCGFHSDFNLAMIGDGEVPCWTCNETGIDMSIIRIPAQEKHYIYLTQMRPIHPVDREGAVKKTKKRAQAGRGAKSLIEDNDWCFSEELMRTHAELKIFKSINSFQVVDMLDGTYLTFEGNGRSEGLKLAFRNDPETLRKIKVEVIEYKFPDKETHKDIVKEIEGVLESYGKPVGIVPYLCSDCKAGIETPPECPCNLNRHSAARRRRLNALLKEIADAKASAAKRQRYGRFPVASERGYCPDLVGDIA